MEDLPHRTSLVPLAFPYFVLCLIGVEAEGLLDYQGRAGDHFHCAVEPSPGHNQCRLHHSYITVIFPKNKRNVIPNPVQSLNLSESILSALSSSRSQ